MDTPSTTKSDPVVERDESTPNAQDEVPGSVQIEVKSRTLDAKSMSACSKRRGKNSAKHVLAKVKKGKSKKKRAKDADTSDSSSSSSSSSSSDSDSDSSDSSDDTSDSDSDSSDDESDTEREEKKKKKKKKKNEKSKAKKKEKAKGKGRRKEKTKSKKRAKKDESSSDSSSDSSDESVASDVASDIDETADKDANTTDSQTQLLQLQLQQLQQQVQLLQMNQNLTHTLTQPPQAINTWALPASTLPPMPKQPPPIRRARKTSSKDADGTSSSKRDRKSKKKRASKLEYKRVDQLWDNTIHNYKLTDTAEDEESSEYDQYLFNVRRTFDWEGKYKTTFVDIKSKLIKEALNEVMDGVKGVSLVEETPCVDPNLLFLYLEDVRKLCKTLKNKKVAPKKGSKRKARKRNESKRKHLKVLLKFLDKDYAETKKTLYPMLEGGLITFDLLWALYKPNTLAYTTTYGSTDQPRAFKIELAEKEHSFMKGDWYSIEGKYLEYDGKNWGMGTYCIVWEATR